MPETTELEWAFHSLTHILSGEINIVGFDGQMVECSKAAFINVISLLAISNYAVSTTEHFFLFFGTFFPAQLKGEGSLFR